MIAPELAADANAAIADIATTATLAIERIVALVAKQHADDEHEDEPEQEPLDPREQARQRQRKRRAQQRDKRDSERDMSRDGHVTSVTESVTERDALRDSRAVVQEQKPQSTTTGNNGVVSSYSSSKSARAQFGNIQDSIERVTKGVTVTRDSVTPSVTERDAERDSVTESVTPIVTEPLALSVTLGKEPTEKLKALFKRHGITNEQREPWLRTVAALLKDKTYHPADVASACDDDEINPITHGPLGLRSFITAARNRRLESGTAVEATEVGKLMTKHHGHIEARRYSLSRYGEPWWNWCIDGAARDGLPSAYHFAALHFDDAWPQEN